MRIDHANEHTASYAAILTLAASAGLSDIAGVELEEGEFLTLSAALEAMSVVPKPVFCRATAKGRWLRIRLTGVPSTHSWLAELRLRQAKGEQEGPVPHELLVASQLDQPILLVTRAGSVRMTIASFRAWFSGYLYTEAIAVVGHTPTEAEQKLGIRQILEAGDKGGVAIHIPLRRRGG